MKSSIFSFCESFEKMVAEIDSIEALKLEAMRKEAALREARLAAEEKRRQQDALLSLSIGNLGPSSPKDAATTTQDSKNNEPNGERPTGTVGPTVEAEKHLFGLFAEPGFYVPVTKPMFNCALIVHNSSIIYMPALEQFPTVASYLLDEAVTYMLDLKPIQLHEYKPHEISPLVDPNYSDGPICSEAARRMGSAFERCVSQAESYRSRFRKYESYVALDIAEFVSQFFETRKDSKTKISEFEDEVRKVGTMIESVHEEVDDYVLLGMFWVEARDLKADLLKTLHRLRKALLRAFKNESMQFAQDLSTRYQAISERMQKEPDTPEELTELKNYLATLGKEKKRLSRRLQELSRRFEVELFLDSMRPA